MKKIKESESLLSNLYFIKFFYYSKTKLKTELNALIVKFMMPNFIAQHIF